MKALALSIVVLVFVTTSASTQQLRPWQPPSHNLLPQQQLDLWNNQEETWQQQSDRLQAERERRHERRMQELDAERRHEELLEELRQGRSR
jgi:hypothetical protein